MIEKGGLAIGGERIVEIGMQGFVCDICHKIGSCLLRTEG
ncbi:hypothetical protein B4168_4140 [Anoxybacillus flavithermus]|nr:hypothetical protein B4168_4140 [Anoxybacillus flavithermus]OAO86012.1 hypothetical protein GT23_2352 [Parageobacillus thermoglucosidasius]